MFPTRHPAFGKWILRFNETPAPRMRLFCLPYAAGSAHLYRGWLRHVTPGLELVGIEPPGRYQRLREAPYRNAPELVTALLDVAGFLMDRPFAVFGHSMGALLALELAYQLRERRLRAPCHLFLSARPAPHVPVAEVHRLEDDALWSVIQERGGLPASAMNDDELREMVLPLMRSDMELVETYDAANRHPIDVPVTALGGSTDDCPMPSQLGTWASYTSAAFSERIFEGGHFFLRSEERAVAQFVDSVLARDAS